MALMILRFPVAAAALLAVLLSSGRASAEDEYVIGEGDTLQVSVWGEKEMSMQVKVRPDGMITLPAVGEVRAAERTPNDLQAALTRKLRRIVKNPVVTVIVSEVTNNKVYVFGGGVRAGVFDLTQRTTLLQLLCRIGQDQDGGRGKSDRGVENADLRNAFIVRKGKVVRRDFHELFINAKLSDDMEIEPNDAVFIPAFRDRNVYVMGAVAAPKAIPYRDGLTAVEAILEAGGFAKFARENGTNIYRKDGDRETKIRVRVKDLMSDGDLRQNASLRPGDYVIVSESLF